MPRHMQLVGPALSFLSQKKPETWDTYKSRELTYYAMADTGVDWGEVMKKNWMTKRQEMDKKRGWNNQVSKYDAEQQQQFDSFFSPCMKRVRIDILLVCFRWWLIFETCSLITRVYTHLTYHSWWKSCSWSILIRNHISQLESRRSLSSLPGRLINQRRAITEEAVAACRFWGPSSAKASHWLTDWLAESGSDKMRSKLRRGSLLLNYEWKSPRSGLPWHTG